MTRDPDVQELLDRARIADTIYAYCEYVDNGDVEATVGLFTVNGVMDLGGGAVHRGHDELRDMFTDRFRLYTTTSFHSSGVRVVRYGTASASTTTYLYGIHEAAKMGRQMHLWGRFEDELVNQSGTWRFRRRHLRVAGLHHQDSGDVPPRFNRITHSSLPEPSNDPAVVHLVAASDTAADREAARGGIMPLTGS
jgi:ketosteroid isomerase-like protein